MLLDSAPSSTQDMMSSLKSTVPTKDTESIDNNKSPPVNYSASPQQSKRPPTSTDESSRKIPMNDVAEKLSASKSCDSADKVEIVDSAVGDEEAESKVEWKMCPVIGV